MPHVSSRSLEQKKLNTIQNVLTSTLTSRRTTHKLQQKALEELFTSTEKIMLSKRVVAVGLLAQGMSSYQVSTLLKLSPNTTAKLEDKLDRGKLQNLAQLVKMASRSPIQQYIATLLQPLPKYGTSPSQLFKDK